jgi:muramoyltetrapeptide carboxypeptidase
MNENGMIYPPQLKEGDLVGITATARKISPGQLEAALKVLKSWGLKTVLAKNIFSSQHSYLAGTDDERREDFQSLIDDPEVKAIFCARGGYGSTRIVEDIDFSSLKRAPKWIIGFSDVTAIHLRLAAMDLASIHGTMPIFFDQPEALGSVESIQKILFTGNCKITLESESFNRPGEGTGEVIGGNLSLIVDALNTPSEPDTKNKILFIEEVDEYFYKLDRMFTQLRRTGKLKDLGGLIIGHMTDMKNSDLEYGESVSQIVLHAVRDYQFPVAFSFPSGHQNPNLAWIHGGRANLTVSVTDVQLSYPNIYSPKE